MTAIATARAASFEAEVSQDEPWGGTQETAIPNRLARINSLMSVGNFLMLRMFCRHVMPHIGPAHPEDDVLGDVGGVVGHALQIAGYEQRVQRLARRLGMFIHGFDQHNEGFIFHPVNYVV